MPSLRGACDEQICCQNHPGEEEGGLSHLWRANSCLPGSEWKPLLPQVLEACCCLCTFSSSQGRCHHTWISHGGQHMNMNPIILFIYYNHQVTVWPGAHVCHKQSQCALIYCWSLLIIFYSTAGTGTTAALGHKCDHTHIALGPISLLQINQYRWGTYLFVDCRFGPYL